MLFSLFRAKILLFGNKVPGKSTALTLYHTISTFNDHRKEAFDNILGKGENIGNSIFSFS